MLDWIGTDQNFAKIFLWEGHANTALILWYIAVRYPRWVPLTSVTSALTWSTGLAKIFSFYVVDFLRFFRCRSCFSFGLFCFVFLFIYSFVCFLLFCFVSFRFFFSIEDRNSLTLAPCILQGATSFPGSLFFPPPPHPSSQKWEKGGALSSRSWGREEERPWERGWCVSYTANGLNSTDGRGGRKMWGKNQ